MFIKDNCWSRFERPGVHVFSVNHILDKVFKNGRSEVFGRQLVKNFIWSILEYFGPYVKGMQLL